MVRDSSPETAELERALLGMDRVAAVRILTGAPALPGRHVVPGIDGAAIPPIPLERIDRLLVPVLRSIGVKWGAGRVALSQVYMASRIADEIIERVDAEHRPMRPGAPRIGIAVLEDHHELGKRIVGMSLRAVGYQPVDYGSGITADELAARSTADGIDLLLVSTLMLRSAMRVEALADLLERHRTRPVLVVGGAPYLFDEGLWREVGADAMGRSAADAIAFAEEVAIDDLDARLAPALARHEATDGADGDDALAAQELPDEDLAADLARRLAGKGRLS